MSSFGIRERTANLGKCMANIRKNHLVQYICTACCKSGLDALDCHEEKRMVQLDNPPIILYGKIVEIVRNSKILYQVLTDKGIYLSIPTRMTYTPFNKLYPGISVEYVHGTMHYGLEVAVGVTAVPHTTIKQTPTILAKPPAEDVKTQLEKTKQQLEQVNGKISMLESGTIALQSMVSALQATITEKQSQITVLTNRCTKLEKHNESLTNILIHGPYKSSETNQKMIPNQIVSIPYMTYPFLSFTAAQFNTNFSSK